MKHLVGVLLFLTGVGVVPSFSEAKTMEVGPCIFSDDPEQVHDANYNPDCYKVLEPEFRVVSGNFIISGIVPGGPPPPPMSGHNPPAPSTAPYQSPYSYPGSQGNGIDINFILSTIERVWNILERAKPVVDIKPPPYAAALPAGIENWTDMEWPSDPRALLFHFSAKNYFNIEVGRYDYVILYTYDGRFEKKGRYLMNMTVFAKDAFAMPGFELNATAEIPSIRNAGTKEDPIAAAEVLVSTNLKSLMTNITRGHSYVLKGDGSYKEIVPVSFVNVSPRYWK